MCVLPGCGVGELEPARGSAPAFTLSTQDVAALNLQGKKQNVRGNFGSGISGFSRVLVSWRPDKWGHALDFFPVKIPFSEARKN